MPERGLLKYRGELYNMRQYRTRISAFTIVELIVVISVIGILAAIGIVSYSGWRNSTIANQLKSDLNGAAAAMESARTFNNVYPATVPATFTPSANITLTGGSSDGKTYCIDATSSQNTTILYYVDQNGGSQGAQPGTCATRPVPPSAPTGLIATAGSDTSISLSWNAGVGAADYLAQCATDSLFTTNLIQTTSTTLAATITGLTPGTAYYCRVQAVNGTGSSAWTSSATVSTASVYNSFAVATSISGYWSTPPDGFLLEDGSAVSRTTYADLFAVIGTTYGVGDGSTTFNLPDSRGRVGVNQNPADAEFNTIGEKYGEKTHLWTVAEMPSHTHIQNPHTHSAVGRTDAIGQATGWAGAASAVRATTSSYTLDNQTISVGATVATNQYTGGSSPHNIIQPSIVKLSAIKYKLPTSTDSVLPTATSLQGYWSTAPNGYLLEDGSAVSRTTYADLFATIGTTYGAGDGSTTFNLPDSRGRVGVNLNSADAEFSTMGEKYGEKTHTVTIAEMPNHTHIQDSHTHSGAGKTDAIGQATGWAGSDSAVRPSTSSYTLDNQTISVSATTATNQNTGGGQPSNVIQPSITKLFAIKYRAPTTSTLALAPATSLGGWWSTIPTGYLTEDGSAVSRSTYAALFAVIGTTYGAGDGSSTFNLPDSRGRVTVNRSLADTEFSTIGEKYGEKTHKLTVAEMPSHTHIQDPHIHTAVGRTDAIGQATGWGGSASAVRASTSSYTLYNGLVTFSGTVATNQSTGGDQPSNIIQPSITKMFVIKY